MMVDKIREKLVALLINKFGKANLETEILITEPEVDEKLFRKPVSINIITGKSFRGKLMLRKHKNFERIITYLAIFYLFGWNDGGFYSFI